MSGAELASECYRKHFSSLMSGSWLWDFGIPAQADSVVPQEPRWPGIPLPASCVHSNSLSFPETGLKSKLKTKKPHSRSAHSPVSLMLCFPQCSLSLALPLSPPVLTEHLPLADHTHGKRQWGHGRSESRPAFSHASVRPSPPHLDPSYPPFCFRTTAVQNYTDPGATLANLQTSSPNRMGRNVSRWQVSSQLCQGGLAVLLWSPHLLPPRLSPLSLFLLQVHV